MSHRPINSKRARRVRKALRPPIPRNFDLVQWLLDHKHAKTKREARTLLIEGKVKADSHILGRVEMPVAIKGKIEMQFVAQPIVSVAHRDNLTVLS
jgi:hypothetical protein